MCSVELYLMHNAQFIMHNCEVSYNSFPCKFKLPSLGEGLGVGFCYFLLQMLSQEGAY